jgi:hypothetical protein
VSLLFRCDAVEWWAKKASEPLVIPASDVQLAVTSPLRLAPFTRLRLVLKSGESFDFSVTASVRMVESALAA